MAAVEIPTMKSIKTGSEGAGAGSEAAEEVAAESAAAQHRVCTRVTDL